MDPSDSAPISEQIYDELRSIARAHFKSERLNHTLQPTALVNEAYLKMAKSKSALPNDRKHFFLLASRAMRQILVDHARARATERRGGGLRRLTLRPEMDTPVGDQDVDLLLLDEAIDRLKDLNPERALLVELRFFGGLSSEQAGEVLGISRTEVARRWRLIKAWLAQEIAEGDST